MLSKVTALHVNNKVINSCNIWYIQQVFLASTYTHCVSDANLIWAAYVNHNQLYKPQVDSPEVTR